MFVEVIPLARLPKNLFSFDYEVPQNFEGQIKIGQMVKISFRGKNVSGIIISLKEKPAENITAIKQIIKIIDPGENVDEARLSLLHWMSDYYLTSPTLILKTFLPEPPQKTSSFETKFKKTALSLSVAKVDLEGIKECVEKIISSKKSFFLFHYQNNKSKAAVLLKLSEKILRENKSVLILLPQVPDIAATLPYFLQLFPDKVAALHGEMSKTEYWHEWQKIKNGQIKIVLGTRSALFAPLKNLGLIIIDNEDSVDFKQSDQNPRYDTRIIAERLGSLTGAKLVLTSLAPRPETYFFAKNSLTAEYIFLKSNDSQAIIIDMNDEIKNKNFSSLSEKIKEKISETIQKNKKVILLLNRRGLSTTIVCRDCEHVFRCKNCEMPLVCHNDECGLPNQFVCHNCGAAEPAQLVCPKCRGTSIKYIGTGTQTVEKELKKCFPKTKILRIDKDANIKEGVTLDADIFIGTQYFVRNYLPRVENVGLIGVVSADTLIYRPDFRSEEKTFSWLMGIINLAREVKISAVIQTFFPNNKVVRSVALENPSLFYDEELENRKLSNYPPFGRLIKLAYSDSDPQKCADEAAKLFKILENNLNGEIELSFEKKPQKEERKFFSKIIIKFSEDNISKVKDILRKNVPDSWTIDIDPENIL
ncbi:MAG: primosomal protein N' [Patescibacteria group bacterium]|jgi:primosomal protein N' (replication factor Y)